MTEDQIVASLIVFAYMAGGLMGASLLYYFQCRSEKKDIAFVESFKPRMQKNDDLEAIADAVR